MNQKSQFECNHTQETKLKNKNNNDSKNNKQLKPH